MLKIAFTAANARLARLGFHRFVGDNQEQVAEFDARRGYLRLKDETEIIVIVGPESLAGRYFDQIILFDDIRGEAKYLMPKDLRFLLNKSLSHSFVPEGFQWLNYIN